MGRDYCAIKDCSNTAGIIGRFGKRVKLHHLPKDKILRSAWIRAISRKSFTPSKYTQICSDHFLDGDGRSWKSDVPTLFLPQKKEKTAKPRTSFNSSTGLQRNAVRCPDTATAPSNWDNTEFHSYAVIQDKPDITTSAPGTATQTTCVDTRDSILETIRPDISIEDIKSSDSKITFYTGLPNYGTFDALFQSLLQHGADKLNVDGNETSKKPTVRKLRLVDEFLLVLMRLRLGLLLEDLAYRFKISSSRISRIFSAWISFMHKCLKQIVFLPNLETLQQKIPDCFSEFKDTRVILDCTEMFIQTPSSLENKSQTYSHYKSHNTYKALVGISMTGAVVFVSELYGGSASDLFITRDSGLIDILDRGDAVMVDKGFAHLKKELQEKGVKLYCPPFLSKSDQFSKSEVESTRRIASARIHVERKMEQIKNFRILQSIIPISLNAVADSIFFVCTALTNLLPPLVN